MKSVVAIRINCMHIEPNTTQNTEYRIRYTEVKVFDSNKDSDNGGNLSLFAICVYACMELDVCVCVCCMCLGRILFMYSTQILINSSSKKSLLTYHNPKFKAKLNKSPVNQYMQHATFIR